MYFSVISYFRRERLSQLMININLLPPQLKMKRIAARRNASLLSICVLLVAAFGILAIIGQSLKSTVEAYLSTSKNAIEKETSVLTEDEELQDLALFVNDRSKETEKINDERVFWSQVIQELNNSVPVSVQFVNLTAKSSKTPNFILQGNTTTEREIIKFKEKLEASSFFKDVTFKSSNLTAGEKDTPGKLQFALEFNLENKKVDGITSEKKDIK